jgi:hypothetical protein
MHLPDVFVDTVHHNPTRAPLELVQARMAPFDTLISLAAPAKPVFINITYMLFCRLA